MHWGVRNSGNIFIYFWSGDENLSKVESLVAEAKKGKDSKYSSSRQLVGNTTLITPKAPSPRIATTYRRSELPLCEVPKFT